MAFKATLEIKAGSRSGTYDVLSCHFNFRRSIDTRGMVTGMVSDGLIYVEVESISSMRFLGNMVSNEILKGSIKFYKADDDQRLKEIKFEDAHIIQYSESMVASGSQSMTANITISPRKIELDGDNCEWNWATHGA